MAPTAAPTSKSTGVETTITITSTGKSASRETTTAEARKPATTDQAVAPKRTGGQAVTSRTAIEPGLAEPVAVPRHVTPIEETHLGEPHAPAGAPVILPPDADAVIEAAAGGDEFSPTTTKMLRRRRRVALVAFVGVAAAVLMVGQLVRKNDGPPTTTIAPVASALPPAARPGGLEGPTAARESGSSAGTTASNQVPADATDGTPSRKVSTAGAFTYVAGYGPVLGAAGPVRRFKVAVERTLGQGDGGDFADEVDRTLGDPRSWVAGGQFRLQRVPASEAAEFTVYLASSQTSTKMCAAGGLSTDGYTSCRLPGEVILNNDRWQDAVPDYAAPLATYRAYALNHEVGHQLGHGHEGCPGKGRAAPVMQQQTYGLKGCVPNAWPYLDGKRYAGPAIS